MIGRLMLLSGMVISLVVPVGGITLAARSSSKSDQQAACARSHNLVGLKQQAAAAETPLASLKPTGEANQGALQGFADAHPQATLDQADYSTYLGLRIAEDQSVAGYNARVSVYNASVDAVNAVIRECTR